MCGHKQTTTGNNFVQKGLAKAKLKGGGTFLLTLYILMFDIMNQEHESSGIILLHCCNISIKGILDKMVTLL